MSRLVGAAVVLFSVWNRRRKARAIEGFIERTGSRSLLLCGATGSGELRNEATIENRIAARVDQVVAFDVVFPGPQPWPFVIADACQMPFVDHAHDLVVANAVIEHVGDEAAQRRLVAEHVRVARHWVITTPNRWFPVESHTWVVLKHWSPRWRAQQDAFTRLLSRKEFRQLLPEGARLVGRPWSPTFSAYSE